MKIYRFLTDDDSSQFCHKVTEALSKGWELYGDPTYAHDATVGVMRLYVDDQQSQPNYHQVRKF